MQKFSFLLILVLVINFRASGQNKEELKSAFPKRELRGVWVATVANIDWPSKAGLSTKEQQDEMIRIFNNHEKIGINAVFFQIRAASDAFYGLSLEPWSEWLTGKQGKSPDPYYDPLQFAIEHAHQRNMEFHAWFNLNRGTHPAGKSIAPDHITRTQPQWFFNYNGTQFYNLGIPEVRNYIVHLVMNIVRNYDVDGIHFDDYFYPYPVAGKKINDEDTFKKYGSAFKNIADWRRDNINQLIKSLSEAINRENPYIKFGISPFGVWRNAGQDAEGSNTARALSSYDDLYADSRYWIQKGWIDYIAPQIYWSFEAKNTPYQHLVDWWSKNKANRHLYIGVASYRIGENSKEWSSNRQIISQLSYNRKNENVSGSILFSSKTLMPNNYKLSDSLSSFYRYPALPPVMQWKIADHLPIPKITEIIRNRDQKRARIQWEIPVESEEFVRAFVIYRFKSNQKVDLDNPANMIKIFRNGEDKLFVDTTLEPGTEYFYTITALDRLWNEGKPDQLYRLK